MKKVTLIVMVLAMTASLFACTSMETFEDNLRDNYSITRLGDSELEEYAESLEIDMDDYNIKSAIEAKHKDKNKTVLIIECDSSENAEKLSVDASFIVDALEAYYKNYSFDAVVEGCFALFGEVDAIGDALGK